jgi:clan AA aspartic protease
MIAGSVNADLEAIIQMMIFGSPSQQQQVEAVIDTGFSGELTLPPALISLLHLTWLGREDGILADGSVDLFDVYRASLLWDGRPRLIEVQAVNSQPLAGMTLLHGQSLRIDVVIGGAVTITALP